MGGNAADALAEAAEINPDGIALVHGGATTTWSVLDSRVTAFARGALARGCRAGDRVVISTANRAELIIAHLGAVRAGLVSVLLNPALTAHELALRTHDTAPTLVICDAVSEVAIREALMTNQIGTEGVVPVGSAAWGDLMRPDHPAREPAQTDPESVATLMFTAAAGRRARAAMISHRALLASVQQLSALTPPVVVEGDVVMLALPLVHSYALHGVLALAIAQRATVVLERRFDPDEGIEVVAREGVTVVAGSPSLFAAWSLLPDLADRMGGASGRGVRGLSLGPSSLAPAISEQFQSLTGTPVREGYGIAECTSLISCTPGVPGGVGYALPGVEIRVVDNDGDDVDDGDPGEVWVRGPQLFDGFWPDGSGGPDDDGWFDTDDVGYFDGDGALHLIDRRHDLIVVSGFPVYPREVEAALSALEGVAECAVVGVDHPASGQAVKAIVVPTAPGAVSIDDVLAHCARVLARFKRPTIVVLAEELPHTVSGELARDQLDASA